MGKTGPVWVLGVVLVLGGALAAWYAHSSRRPAPAGGGAEPDPRPADPRLFYAGPLRNVRPGVRYVGDDRCAGCHEGIARSYRGHPMGRSLAPVAAVAARQSYGRARHNPFEAFGVVFRVDRRGDRVDHRQSRLDKAGRPLYDFAHPVRYVVGSGKSGHSYLTERDGFVFQTPVSWYSDKQIWGLSPGFSPWLITGRPVVASCLFCHANRVEPVEHTRNAYRPPVFRGEAIGCERCHGPGEVHCRTTQKEDVVNPAALDPALREAVCQQCHLQGLARFPRRGRAAEEYRPGLALQDFLTVFVRGPGSDRQDRAVNHVEQMYQSECFNKSAGRRRLGCTSCHDPHAAVPPARRAAHYRDRCLRCHAERPCGLPRPARVEKADDDCTACHMPRKANADVAHTASTDHRILRAPGGASTRRRVPGGPSGLPLLDFYRGAPDLEDAEAARDLGVALHHVTRMGRPLTAPAAAFALRLLGEALALHPDDLDAAEAKGTLLQAVGRPAEAAEVFEGMLRRAPRHENALVALGVIYRDRGERDKAVAVWRRAVEVSPHAAEYRRNLVLQLAAGGAWGELRPHCEAWLELDPGSAEAREVWAKDLLRRGRAAEAAAQRATAEALRRSRERHPVVGGPARLP